MVVTVDSPTLATGITQERNGVPFRCTVQAPHKALPQPNFVPVMPSTSRKTHSKGISPSTSTSCSAPLTLILKAIDQPSWDRATIFGRLKHNSGISTHSKDRTSGSPDLRFGSLADIRGRIRDGRFTLKSGHARRRIRCLLGANSGDSSNWPVEGNVHQPLNRSRFATW